VEYYLSKFDRYILSQLLIIFSFFTLILIIVFWINRAVQLFESLIGEGQPTTIFLEFTALGMPRLITVVLPIAAFTASAYLTNKLNQESEIKIIMAAGTSHWRIVRPILIFGLITGGVMGVLSHFLVPMAAEKISNRETDITNDVLTQFLTQGTFLNPSEGVTIYTRDIGDDGVLRDIFIADHRDAKRYIIYTAREAYLVQNDDNKSLIMINGIAQILSEPGRRLSTARFKDFSFDINALIKKNSNDDYSIKHMTSPNLFYNWKDVAKNNNTTPGAVAEELHSRFARALFCVVSALVGFTVLIFGNHSKLNAWPKIIFAFLFLLILDGMRSGISVPVLLNANYWPILYLPSLLGLLLVLTLLWTATNLRLLLYHSRNKA